MDNLLDFWGGLFGINVQCTVDAQLTGFLWGRSGLMYSIGDAKQTSFLGEPFENMYSVYHWHDVLLGLKMVLQYLSSFA